MKKFTVVLCGAILLGSLCKAEQSSDHAKPVRPVHTFSIVAYDSITGQFGAAVQSHWFKVADVIWAEPGVGAVATQSLADFRYGPLGLEMMKMGKTAQQALDGVLASDPENRVRQVAMIDKNGIVAAHTGSLCIAEAGHQTGVNYSVQANLMEKATVWPAMAAAFESAQGDLADKMMAALDAAQAEGGDIRGRQSAAILVVAAKPTGQSWRDRIVDLRVDDSPEPLKELHRLLSISRAYDEMNRGDELIAKGNIEEAGIAYENAAKLDPGNMEILFWHAVTLVENDEVERSLPIFRKIFAADEHWRTLVPRLVTAELFPDDKEILSKVLAQ